MIKQTLPKSIIMDDDNFSYQIQKLDNIKNPIIYLKTLKFKDTLFLWVQVSLKVLLMSSTKIRFISSMKLLSCRIHGRDFFRTPETIGYQ